MTLQVQRTHCFPGKLFTEMVNPETKANKITWQKKINNKRVFGKSGKKSYLWQKTWWRWPLTTSDLCLEDNGKMPTKFIKHTHTNIQKKERKWVQNFILSQDGMWVKSNIPICFICQYIVLLFPWALIVETTRAIQEMNGKSMAKDWQWALDLFSNRTEAKTNAGL